MNYQLHPEEATKVVSSAAIHDSDMNEDELDEHRELILQEEYQKLSEQRVTFQSAAEKSERNSQTLEV